MDTNLWIQIISCVMSALAVILSYVAFSHTKTKEEQQELVDLKESASDDHIKLTVMESQLSKVIIDGAQDTAHEAICNAGHMQHSVDIAVLKSQTFALKETLDKLDAKLDKIIESL